MYIFNNIYIIDTVRNIRVKLTVALHTVTVTLGNRLFMFNTEPGLQFRGVLKYFITAQTKEVPPPLRSTCFFVQIPLGQK